MTRYRLPASSPGQDRHGRLIAATSSVGPLFAGLARDWSGDFRLALVTFASMPLLVALLSLVAHPPRRGAGAIEIKPAVAMVDGM